MLENKDYCDYETCHELMMMGLEPSVHYDSCHSLLLYEAQKWLREEKDIQIEVPISFKYNSVWKFSFRLQTREFYYKAIGEWDTYEEALFEGVKCAVKILKEK